MGFYLVIWLQGATHVSHACYICWSCIGSFKTCHKNWNLVRIKNNSLPCCFTPHKRNNYVEFSGNKVTWQGVCFIIKVNQNWVSMWFSNQRWILFNIIIVNAPISYREERRGEVLTPTFRTIKKRTKTFQHVIGINISCDILIIISFK